MSTEVLDGRVLVLSKSWIPINVTTVFDAVCKTFQGSALMVDPETYGVYDFESWLCEWEDAIAYARLAEGKVLNCANFGIRVPEVILCKGYSGAGHVNLDARPKFSRRNVYLRDDYTCQYCGKRGSSNELNLDHVMPKSRGGPMDWTNIVLSCIPCNDKKANRTPAEAKMSLIRHPRVPTATELRRPFHGRLMRKLGCKVPKNWEAFLGKMYWESELS